MRTRPKPDKSEPNRGRVLRPEEVVGCGDGHGSADAAVCGERDGRAVVPRPHHHHLVSAGGVLCPGQASFLHSRGTRIFHYLQFGLPMRGRVRDNDQTLAVERDAMIEHVAKEHIRKADGHKVLAELRLPAGDAHAALEC